MQLSTQHGDVTVILHATLHLKQLSLSFSRVACYRGNNVEHMVWVATRLTKWMWVAAHVLELNSLDTAVSAKSVEQPLIHLVRQLSHLAT